jgi:hypothetical protein
MALCPNLLVESGKVGRDNSLLRTSTYVKDSRARKDEGLCTKKYGEEEENKERK